MRHVRISRYDPALRDDRGAFGGHTWTSIADGLPFWAKIIRDNNIKAGS